MNRDLYSLHIFWEHTRFVFEKELASGLSGSEEAIVRELYNKLKNFYDASLVISEKVDEMFL